MVFMTQGIVVGMARKATAVLEATLHPHDIHASDKQRLESVTWHASHAICLAWIVSCMHVTMYIIDGYDHATFDHHHCGCLVLMAFTSCMTWLWCKCACMPESNQHVSPLPPAGSGTAKMQHTSHAASALVLWQMWCHAFIHMGGL